MSTETIVLIGLFSIILILIYRAVRRRKCKNCRRKCKATGKSTPSHIQYYCGNCDTMHWYRHWSNY